MKVLIPVWGFGRAGGYRVLSKLADQLLERNVEVHFLCSECSDIPYYPTRAKTIWVHKSGKILSKPKGGGGIFFTHFLSLKRGMKTVFRNTDYDIILANHNLTVYPAIFAGLKSKVVYYVQAYEPEYYSMAKGLKNLVLSRLALLTYKLRLFTIVNADVYRNYREIRSAYVLYPGVDFNVFFPGKAEVEPRRTIILGTIGRKELHKGSMFVIEAFQELKKTYDNIEMHIAFGDLESIDEPTGISTLTPENDAELAEFYNNLDFYISGGTVQLGAFHYPVAEAMACKVCVVSTHYFPATEQNCFLVQPKSTNQLVNAIKYAIEHPSVVREKVANAFHDVSKLTWEKSGDLLHYYLSKKIAQK